MELLETHKSFCVFEGWSKQPTNPQTLKILRESHVQKKERGMEGKKKGREEEVRIDLEGLQKGYRTKPV